MQDLAMRSFVFLSSCMIGLIGTHCNLSVSGAGHGTLVNICRSYYNILVIHYHSLCMDIYHKPLKLLRKRNLDKRKIIMEKKRMICRSLFYLGG